MYTDTITITCITHSNQLEDVMYCYSGRVNVRVKSTYNNNNTKTERGGMGQKKNNIETLSCINKTTHNVFHLKMR